MKTLVKICGLTRAQDVETAMLYGADFLGFIVEAASKRRLSVETAAQIALPARGLIPRVAVTVNADDDLLARIMAQMQPDYIQCHGDEPPKRVAEIAKTFNVKTIKAVPISTKTDMITAAEYALADFILYDAKPPKDGPKNIPRGGHGTAFDWSLLRTSPTPKFYALAGGLKPENTREAIAATSAPMLDVSSGVEASAGIKDPAKIKAFMEAVQNG
ncbi:MAG: phosphoribosylanthranilate isomerase [Maricaulaceae bacterium]